MKGTQMKRKIFAVIAVALASQQALAIGHLARIDLYDRTEQRTLPIYWHMGNAYVVGSPGNEYQISVRNAAGVDVLAVVSVDGINVVSGETAAPNQTGYVIDQWQQMEIAGWRKNLSRTAAFYFTSLGDSYAARTGRPNHAGVIGAALYRRKPDPVAFAPERSAQSDAAGPRDRTESSANSSPQSSAPSSQAAPSHRAEKSQDDRRANTLGTGHGRQEPSPARYTTFERATSSPEEVIRIYYDSHANLVARGVIASQPWRDPQPFPGRFVPDPPR
jgi:hypothetical protein